MEQNTTLTITDMVIHCPELLGILVRLLGSSQWSFITASKLFYDIYLKKPAEIPSYFKNPASLSPECTKILRDQLNKTSWGPLKCREISDFEKPIKAVYLGGIDLLLRGFCNLKFAHSLDTLVIRNVFLPSVNHPRMKHLSMLVSLRCLYLEECVTRYGYSDKVFSECKNLEILHIAFSESQPTKYIQLEIPENLKMLTVLGEANNMETIVIKAPHCTKLGYL